ncbi:MAG: zf-TFIIB domain-containing protein [Candidatus Altiarchaeota archaeon]
MVKCPKDGKEMNRKTVNGVELDVCGKCGGVWMDWGELQRVSDGKVTEHELVEKERSNSSCPRCDKKMNVAELNSVILENCRCGIFFDAGEAEEVIGRDIGLKSAGDKVIEVDAAQLKELLEKGRIKAGTTEIILRRKK